MFTVKTSKGNEYKIVFQQAPNTPWHDEKARGSGVTRCIMNEDYKNSGDSLCSFSDQFSYETGRRISLTRAIKHLPRNERKEIWAAYWAKKEADRARSKKAAIKRHEEAFAKQLRERAAELADIPYVIDE